MKPILVHPMWLVTLVALTLAVGLVTGASLAGLATSREAADGPISAPLSEFGPTRQETAADGAGDQTAQELADTSRGTPSMKAAGAPGYADNPPASTSDPKVPARPSPVEPAPEPQPPARIEQPAKPVSAPRVEEPVKLEEPQPYYPRLVIAGEKGGVQCLLHISEAGQVTQVDVTESSGNERLDAVAREDLLLWRFEPKRVDGQPVATSIIRRVDWRPSESRPWLAEKHDTKMAWEWAKVLIATNQLKAPKTAEWPTDGLLSGHKADDFVTYEGAGEYAIKAWVDAENAFSAKLRIHFRARVKDIGDGTWILTSFREE